MPLMLPAQGLLKPVDDAFGVEPPSRFAEALDHVRSGLARCGQAGIRKPGVSMVTSRILGSFRDDPATRRGGLAIIGSPKSGANGS